MPRATQSRESGIVAYFKTAEMAVAEVILGLVKEVIAERRAKSAAGRAAQQRVVSPTPAPRPVAPVRELAKTAVATHRKQAKGKPKGKAKPTAASTRPPTARQIEAEVNGGGATLDNLSD